MPEELLVFPLVPDLPEDWVIDSIITPNGTEVGLTERYGYNYLMKMVNTALKAANQTDARITTSIANLEAIPKGIVAMWAGELINIPAGWKLCDGLEGRPNMLARFIRGIQTSVTNPGATGGADSLTLSAANMPSHKHSMGTHTHTETAHAHAMTHSHTVTGSLSSAGSHTHSVNTYSYNKAAYYLVVEQTAAIYNFPVQSVSSSYYTVGSYNVSQCYYSRSPSAAGDHSHTLSDASVPAFSGNSGSVGAGTALAILPTYYALAFIIKT